MNARTSWLNPLWQLLLARWRDLTREGWVVNAFVLPVVLSGMVYVGFTRSAGREVTVGVIESPHAADVKGWLDQPGKSRAVIVTEAEGARRLKQGEVSSLLYPGDPLRLVFDPRDSESQLARLLVGEALQRGQGQTLRAPLTEEPRQIPGSRYIDFLIPGIFCVQVMGGTIQNVMWGLVMMRIRKLFKQFAATPIRKSHFLSAFVLGRMTYGMLLLGYYLLFALVLFKFRVAGSLPLLAAYSLLGITMFSTLGLAIGTFCHSFPAASAAASLVMLPMAFLSGAFFSYKNFPEMLWPFIRLIPMTAFLEGFRAITNEGLGVAALTRPAAVLIGWTLLTGGVVAWRFRWT